MFRALVDWTRIAIRHSEPLTTGSVNAQAVQFVFSDEWAELDKTAVFTCNGVTKAVHIDSAEGIIKIPWECLVSANVGWPVYGGVCGTKDETVVVPTIMASFGTLGRGASTDEADNAQDPTPTLYEQYVADVIAYAEAAAASAVTSETAANSATVSAQQAQQVADGMEAMVESEVKTQVDAAAAAAIEEIQAAADEAAEAAANAQDIIAKISSLVKTEVDTQMSTAKAEIQSAAESAAASAAESAAADSKQETLDAISDLISSYGLAFEVDEDDGGLNIIASDYDDMY